MEGSYGFSSLGGLPHGKRSRDEISDQAQIENSATSLLTDPPPDSYVSSFSPGSELEAFPWAMNYTDMLLASEIEDCNSEALSTYAEQCRPPLEPHHCQTSSGEANQDFVTPFFRRQISADRVQNSIENLQVFYERLSSLVDPDHGRVYGESSQAKLRRTLDTSFGDSTVAASQVCNRDRQFVCDLVDHALRAQKGSDDGPWQWLSRASQSSLTEAVMTTDSPVSRTEEGGESKYTASASTADIKDLLCSLHRLLAVLKSHEVTEEISRSKTQALREKKEALRLAKQQYKDLKVQRSQSTQFGSLLQIRAQCLPSLRKVIPHD